MSKNIKILAAVQSLSFLLLAFPAAALTFPEIDQQARAKFQEARQNYSTTTGAYQNTKQAVIQAQTKLKNAGQEQKNAVKTQLEEKARQFLANSVNSMIKYLEAMKNKIGNVRGIAEDDRKILLDELDNETAWLQARSTQVKTASGDQLKTIRDEIQNRWRATHRIARRLTGQTLAFRINYVIEKSEVLGLKVADRIAELKKEGKDVSGAEARLAEFRAKLTAAKEQYDLAKQKFQSVSSAAEADKLIVEGQNYVKAANQYVKQAQVILNQLVKDLKKMEPKTEASQ